MQGNIVFDILSCYCCGCLATFQEFREVSSLFLVFLHILGYRNRPPLAAAGRHPRRSVHHRHQRRQVRHGQLPAGCGASAPPLQRRAALPPPAHPGPIARLVVSGPSEAHRGRRRWICLGRRRRRRRPVDLLARARAAPLPGRCKWRTERRGEPPPPPPPGGSATLEGGRAAAAAAALKRALVRVQGWPRLPRDRLPAVTVLARAPPDII